MTASHHEGILPLVKPRGVTSFRLVSLLRKILNVKKIGHAGTLDPFATGVMVMLIGKNYTRLSDQFIKTDKEYLAEVHFGIATDTYDCDGQVVSESKVVPTLQEIKEQLLHFQGTIKQKPPMFSAKKVNGKKLYELARQGKEIERKEVDVHLNTTLVSYDYPKLILNISCSKGTYIRSIAHELGEKLGCGAHLTQLERRRSGALTLESCLDAQTLFSDEKSLDEKQEQIRNHLICH